MNDKPARLERDVWELEHVAALAEIEAGLDGLEAQLQGAPDWQPGAVLLAQAAWLRGRLQRIRDSWDTRLVVAVVGPSGAGKSTLLNALAGAELSQTGLERPTTRQVMAFVGDPQAARPLAEALGGLEMQVDTSSRGEALDYLTLLDTPDTNTLPENQAILRRVLEVADVILAVFPAQNPRLHDNLTFLRPFVQRLPRENVIPVLNMVDRVPLGEVEEVTADFRRALHTEWDLQPERIYRISAKRSGPQPYFPDDETPLTDLNEFAELERLIFETLNRGSQVIDRRTGRAQRLYALFEDQVQRALDATAAPRARAQEALDELSRQLAETAHRSMPGPMAGVRGLDLGASLYGMLGPRWWGPVGWLVGLWALVLRAASFVARLGRRAPSLLSREAAPAQPSEQELAAGFPSAEVTHVLLAGWPPAADLLVAAGFGPRARDAAAWQARLDAALEQMAARSASHYGERLALLAERLSAWPIQALLNLPVLGMVGWIGVEAVVAFVRRTYLPSAYFQNGAMAVGAVWALAYVLLQAIVSVSIRRLRRGGLHRELGRALAEELLAPWANQLQVTRELRGRR